MNALPLTLLFLLLLAFLAYGSLNKGIDKLVELKMVKGMMEEKRKEQGEWQKTVYLIEKGKKIEGTPSPSNPRSIKKNEKAPAPKAGKPLIFPRKLNLALATKEGEKRSSYREVSEKLIKRLYSDYLPFDTRPTIAGELIDRLLEATKEKQILLPEHLASLDMGDLQPLWQEMLLGDKCPPLLDYIYFKNKQKTILNITWAPEPLLSVLFDDSAKIERLLELQEKVALAELDEEWDSPFIEQYKEAAQIADSPYSKILTCKLSRKLET